jgi:hypothetical protein
MQLVTININTIMVKYLICLIKSVSLYRFILMGILLPQTLVILQLYLTCKSFFIDEELSDYW